MAERKRSQRSVFPSDPCPWLVYPYGKGMKNQLFCSLSQPHKTYHKRIPELRGVIEIVAQCAGWFVLRKKFTQFSLWNPTITNCNSIQLPPLKSSLSAHHICDCVLSSPPGDPDCKFILFDKVVPSIIFIRPEAADKQWTEITLNKNRDDDDCFSEGAFCNGKLYSVTYPDRKLAEINVDEANGLLIEYLPCQRVNTLKTFKVHELPCLVECCGELIHVDIGYCGIRFEEIIEVHVFKLDFSRMIWERAESLMGQAIFVDGRNSFSCTAIGDRVQSDCIYFTQYLEKGLYSYNVKDCYLSLNLPYPSVPTPWGSPMILAPNDVRFMECYSRDKDEQSQEETAEEEIAAEEIQKEETMFSDLPSDALEVIAKCLNLFDYLNFRAVCRDCRLTLSKLERTQTLQKLKAFPPSAPWLVFLTNNIGAFNIVDPIHGDRLLMTLPESLVGNTVRHSRNGWLLMADGKKSMSFFNPFTEKIIKLPDPPRGYSSSLGMAFTTLPTSPDCVVVACECFSSLVDLSSSVIATMGEKDWHESHVHYVSTEFTLSDIGPVFHEGSFYVMGQQGNLSVLSYKEERIGLDLELSWSTTWKILDRPISPCNAFHQIFLLECDEKLMSIFVGNKGKWVQAFSLNMTSMSWERVKNLGNHVIYVSRFSCISMEAKIKGTENRIYFPRFHGSNILYYSLNTGKFHYDNEGTIEGFYNTKEPLLASWIDPNPKYWH